MFFTKWRELEMIKVFKSDLAEDLAAEINIFGKTENIIATQIYPLNSQWVAFVYYNTNNGYNKPVTGPKEETKGMMKDEPALEEVGGAWPNKYKKDLLSVKDKKTGKYSNWKISDLEETEEGFRFEDDEKIIIFKRIEEKDRVNDKMPHYGVFRVISD